MAGAALSERAASLHRLLERQLRKVGVPDLEPPPTHAWARLLPMIDAHYRAGDEDRYLLERSLEISSREMRALHHAVSTERSQLEAVLLALPQGVIVVDEGDAVVVCNRAAASWIEREPAPGELVNACLSFERDGRAINLTDAIAADTDDVVIVGDSGRRTPVHVARVSTGGEHQVITLTDLTERLRAFAALHEARVSAEVARRAEQARGAFLARMSHELRTPLNAILGYAELLSDEASNPRIQSDLQRIHGAGRHLLGLINDVLDLSKMDAGRMELDQRETDLGALLREAAEDLRPVVERQHNTLRIDAPAGVSAMVDRAKLKQCLYNLLSNAARFTDSGEVAVTLQTDPAEFVIAVSDTGAGIAAVDLDRVFEPFAQSGPSRGGTGLGLALVAATCELMGGRCTVRSEVGRGSTFQIHLPR